MGCPLMSRKASGSTGGAPSITLPEPLKELQVWDVGWRVSKYGGVYLYEFMCTHAVVGPDQSPRQNKTLDRKQQTNINAPAQHLLRHGRAEDIPRKLRRGVAVVDAGGPLKDLHHRLLPRHLQHLACLCICGGDVVCRAWVGLIGLGGAIHTRTHLQVDVYAASSKPRPTPFSIRPPLRAHAITIPLDSTPTHLPLALLPVAQRQIHDLGELGQLHVVEDHQWAVHALDRRVLEAGAGGGLECE